MARAQPDARAPAASCVRLVGRYALYDEIASGGMASVHFGRLLGPAGFARSVAIKRLHPQFAKDPEFVAMFLDEARLAARVRHPNVVPTIDVVAAEGELFLVMEYVQGESLARLVRARSRDGERVPPRMAITVMIQALWGLHAAHEAKTERGAPLGIIHRDVSPQNILVGDDGAARIVDFGVAKAAWRVQSTRDGRLKGKFAYMAPEQLNGSANVDRRVDVYAASVVLWEALTGKRYLGSDEHPAVMMKRALERVPEPPSTLAPDVPPAIDAIVLRGLASEPQGRFATANDMAVALEQLGVMASAREVAEWVTRSAGEALGRRAVVLAEIESVSTASVPPHPPSVKELPSSDLETVYSQVSEPGSVSRAAVPREAEPRPGSSRLRGPAVYWGAAAAFAGIVAVSVWAARGPSSRAEQAAAAAGSIAPTPSAPQAPMPDVSDTASAAAPSPPSSAPDPAAPARPPAVVTQPARRPPPRADCIPPYTIDADGVRIPKPQCLHR